MPDHIPPMTPAEAAKVRRIESIYRQFMAEMEQLQAEQTSVIQAVLEEVNQQEIDITLKSLKQL